MNSLNLRISISSIIIVFLYILQFVGMPYTPWFNYIKYFLILIIGIYIFKNFRLITKRKYLAVNSIAVIFSVLVVFSSFINRELVSGRNIFFAAIIFCVTMLEAFFGFEILLGLGHLKKMLKLFRNCAIAEILICDFLLLVLPDIFWKGGINCIIGSKFTVMYTHLWTIMFVLIYRFIKNRRIFNLSFALMFLWTVFISIKVDCVTGLLGVVVFSALMMVIVKFNKIILNPVTLVILLAASFAFIFLYDLALGNSVVRNLIVNVFGRQNTMNSRLKIYGLALEYLQGHFLFGVGYGSAYELGMAYGGFANTQNSILDWIWQAGIPATIIMLALIILCFTKMSKINEISESKENLRYLYPAAALIYVYIFLGSVEITMSNSFFALCAIGYIMAEQEIMDNFYQSDTVKLGEKS